MNAAPEAVRRLSERLYPEYRSESDLLDEVVRRMLPPQGRVLDVGCGGGRLFPNDYRAIGRLVLGIDLDPAVGGNALLDNGAVASVEELPFLDGSFDLVYSRYVFEHLPRPDVALREIARVLRPGGTLVLLTPNRRHYVALAARFTPHAFHRRFNARRGRPEHETFPTLYRANTPGRVRRLSRAAGLEEIETSMIETRPNYLMFSRLAFLAGVAYERLVSATRLLAGLRVNILAVYQKPDVGSHGLVGELAAPDATGSE